MLGRVGVALGEAGVNIVLRGGGPAPRRRRRRRPGHDGGHRRRRRAPGGRRRYRRQRRLRRGPHGQPVGPFTSRLNARLRRAPPALSGRRPARQRRPTLPPGAVRESQPLAVEVQPADQLGGGRCESERTPPSVVPVRRAWSTWTSVKPESAPYVGDARPSPAIADLLGAAAWRATSGCSRRLGRRVPLDREASSASGSRRAGGSAASLPSELPGSNPPGQAALRRQYGHAAGTAALLRAISAGHGRPRRGSTQGSAPAFTAAQPRPGARHRWVSSRMARHDSIGRSRAGRPGPGCGLSPGVLPGRGDHIEHSG